MSVTRETTNLKALAEMVVKNGVWLGTLTHPERLLALRVPAAALAEGATFSEPEVNAALKAALAGPAAFLATDHVELRRWLVDTGWWRRDGYGRAYSRTPASELAEDLLVVEQLVAPLSFQTWVARQREALAAVRAARRQAWAAKAGAQPEFAAHGTRPAP